jgi:hypothetical protein
MNPPIKDGLCAVEFGCVSQIEVRIGFGAIGFVYGRDIVFIVGIRISVSTPVRSLSSLRKTQSHAPPSTKTYLIPPSLPSPSSRHFPLLLAALLWKKATRPTVLLPALHGGAMCGIRGRSLGRKWKGERGDRLKGIRTVRHIEVVRRK